MLVDYGQSWSLLMVDSHGQGGWSTESNPSDFWCWIWRLDHQRMITTNMKGCLFSGVPLTGSASGVVMCSQINSVRLFEWSVSKKTGTSPAEPNEKASSNEPFLFSETHHLRKKKKHIANPYRLCISLTSWGIITSPQISCTICTICTTNNQYEQLPANVNYDWPFIEPNISFKKLRVIQKNG